MSLSRTQSLRMTAALEDCSTKMDIVRHLLTVQISGEPAAQEKVRLAKLTGDCQYISLQMSTLCLELREKQSFISLLQVVEEEEQKQKADVKTREAKIELKYREQALQMQMEAFQIKTDKLKDMERLCRDMEKQHKEQLSKIANKKKTEERSAELQLQLRQKETCHAEKLLEDRLELLQKQLKEEIMLHQKSEKFLQNQHEELKQLLDKWEQRTKQMLQEKERQLNTVCCKKTLNFDKLMERKRQLKEMEQVVMEDREEQKKLLQKQKEVRAATKLQAWWRGWMVRRGLGSFKKAEENKKGTAKKEGKKKKKK
ncbi:dynein regulatory complex protein 9 [Acanthochromis polyacanthus]|uniref:Dynein regulatory complex protein 9 n=1 Tax=Acanthochromis polyacanthus TaxID=80966 RepID=A0A3Q1FAG9_9TELE|nr:dynein regulatory complex protein 9 [Acanthochromis polyacanthus]